MGVAFSNKLCDKQESHFHGSDCTVPLLKQGALSFKASSELVFVFSLRDGCSHVHLEAGYRMSQAVLRVCHEKVQRL